MVFEQRLLFHALLLLLVEVAIFHVESAVRQRTKAFTWHEIAVNNEKNATKSYCLTVIEYM